MTQTEGRLIVVGGRQRAGALDLDEWHAYEKAIVAIIDLPDGQPEVVVEYETPEEYRVAETPSIVFKAGELQQNSLLTCTQTELLEFNTLDWALNHRWSHPWMNDVHHVCRGLSANRFLVANTGLDQIIEFETAGSDEVPVVINQWNVGQDATWDRFDKNIDYRKVPTTKPHQSHPNFVWSHRGRIYATRFHQQDMVDVESGKSIARVDSGNPHDGIVHLDQVSVTTTNGNVCTFVQQNSQWKNRRTVDLAQIEGESSLLGWCRGLCLIDESLAWIGFSRIRPTWLRKNLSWIKQGFQNKGVYGMAPTRVSLYDLERQKKIQEIDLEPIGLNAVFSIHWERVES